VRGPPRKLLSSSISSSNNRQRRKKKTTSKVTRTKSKTPQPCAMHDSSYRLMDGSGATVSDNANNGVCGNVDCTGQTAPIQGHLSQNPTFRGFDDITENQGAVNFNKTRS
jgi:hypothetical protein